MIRIPASFVVDGGFPAPFIRRILYISRATLPGGQYAIIVTVDHLGSLGEVFIFRPLHEPGECTEYHD
jgi:hypothetical protein